MNSISIEVKELHFTYPDGVSALHHINFSIMPGESVALVGANGAGKSTLLKHFNGDLRASSGSVYIHNKEIGDKNVREIRRTVGSIFAEPDDQLFMPTVEEDVAFGPRHMGLDESAIRARVDRAIAMVEGDLFRKKPPHRLSTGEKRRAAIASVLSMEPQILVMDEPAANLDPLSRLHLIQTLKTFSQTKIIATHDLDFVLAVSSRVILLHEGTMIADGIPKIILSDNELMMRSRLIKPIALEACPQCGYIQSS